MLKFLRFTGDGNTLTETVQGDSHAILGIFADPVKDVTVDDVKESLPDVPVDICGTVYPGIVSGRKLPFAQVRVEFGEGTPDVEFYCTWETIVESLAYDIPIQY